MNTQLVDSILQVVQALPNDEKTLLLDRIDQLISGQVHCEETNTTDTESSDDHAIDAEAWAVWESLGDDATLGQLKNTSLEHDRYLYSSD